MGTYTVQKVLNIFGTDINRNTLIKAEGAGQIPAPARQETGAIRRRAWSIDDLPAIGERYGFLKKLDRPTTVAIFTTKGGVLKTTLSLNLARMAALHGIRTCVVGLDLQGDVSTALGFNAEIEETESLNEAVERLQRANGLYSFLAHKVELEDLLIRTEIPTLSYIPETPELVQLEQAISLKNNRDFWLRDYVIKPLQKKFDLIVLDCSPNWNRLVTNALVACDALISPLECKINNFRNYSVFGPFIDEFKRDLKLDFEQIYVPTRFTSTRKLSAEIRSWYLTHVHGCVHGVIRESVHGEEATAMRLSVPEYAPTSLVADEMREVLLQVWERISTTVRKTMISQPTALSPTPRGNVQAELTV